MVLTVQKIYRITSPMMTAREQLLTVASAYAAARDISIARVSTIVFNHGRRLRGVAEGRDICTGTFERAMLWFSRNWPDDTEWPDGISRPVVTARE